MQDFDDLDLSSLDLDLDSLDLDLDLDSVDFDLDDFSMDLGEEVNGVNEIPNDKLLALLERIAKALEGICNIMQRGLFVYNEE